MEQDNQDKELQNEDSFKPIIYSDSDDEPKTNCENYKSNKRNVNE